MHWVATECHLCTIPLRTRMLQPAARCRAALRLAGLLGTHTRGTILVTIVARCTVGRSSARRAGLMHVPCAPTTADGVPRLLGTHTCCTIVAGCNFGFLPLGGQVSCTCCVRAAWYGSPLYARMCILDCAHHSPPQLNPPPAHICIGTESIPCPPLHRERVRPAPTSAPRPNPLPRRHLRHHCRPPGHLPLRSNTGVTQRNVLQPRALCCNRVPPVHDPFL